MSKLRLVYRCTACATAYPKWAGRCPSCEAWNSMVEDVEGPDPDIASLLIATSTGTAMPIAEVDTLIGGPQSTGIEELDRVLGGGLVPGAVTLLGGEPGIGKSTLLLQLAAAWPTRTLYVSGEESAQQVRLRAERLGALGPNLWLLAETSLPHVIAALDTVRTTTRHHRQHPIGRRPRPRFGAGKRRAGARLHPSAGGRSQASRDTDGAGGSRHQRRRPRRPSGARAHRRHGAQLRRRPSPRLAPAARRQAPLRVDQRTGVFEMVEHGLVGVPDASSLFLTDRRTGVAGSAVTPTLEGHRPLLVEVQALTNKVTPGAPPRRSAQGLDPGRLALLLAVLERRARLPMAQHEVFASAVGGVRLTEPGSDLPMCLAIVSALADHPLPSDVISFGEIGLAGELRQVVACIASTRRGGTTRVHHGRSCRPTRPTVSKASR